MIQRYDELDAGGRYAGLTTVGYRLYDAAGQIVGSRIAVAETRPGVYGATVAYPDYFAGSRVWDTGGSSPLTLSVAVDLVAATQQMYAAARAVTGGPLNVPPGGSSKVGFGTDGLLNFDAAPVVSVKQGQTVVSSVVGSVQHPPTVAGKYELDVTAAADAPVGDYLVYVDCVVAQQPRRFVCRVKVDTFTADVSAGTAPGAGADTLTCVFAIDVTHPVADADAWITRDAAGTQVIDRGRTDTDGRVVFLVDGYVTPGNKRTFYFFAQKDGIESRKAVPVVCD